MTNNIVPFNNATASATGLKIKNGLSFEEWQTIGGTLEKIGNSYTWWVGDWWNYGQREYGEMASQEARSSVKDETGLSYNTVSSAGWVCNKIEFSRRRESLTPSHHREVASLEIEEQDKFLDLAESLGWDSKTMRDEVRKYVREPKPELVDSGKSPVLMVGSADDTKLDAESIDIIITSPPYNLGADEWAMGGNGRTPRVDGIGYKDAMSEADYQMWQVDCLNEMYRVAKPGASLFYNHKVRQQDGEIIHPYDWITKTEWKIRQEIIWDRGSTHNHVPSLFWQHDERIYWMTKGKPVLPKRPVGHPSIIKIDFQVNNWHPAPFPIELPLLFLDAVGREGVTVLDPFAGSCTTLKAALLLGYDAVGIEINEKYLENAIKENGWKKIKRN